MIKIKRRVAL